MGKTVAIPGEPKRPYTGTTNGRLRGASHGHLQPFHQRSGIRVGPRVKQNTRDLNTCRVRRGSLTVRRQLCSSRRHQQSPTRPVGLQDCPSVYQQTGTPSCLIQLSGITRPLQRLVTRRPVTRLTRIVPPYRHKPHRLRLDIRRRLETLPEPVLGPLRFPRTTICYPLISRSLSWRQRARCS